MKHTQAATRTPSDAHAHTHAYAGWLMEAQMHIVTLKCANTCACTQTLKPRRIRTHNHTHNHTSGWLSAQVQRRERTRDRRNVAHFPNNLLGPDCTSCISTRGVESPLHINSCVHCVHKPSSGGDHFWSEDFNGGIELNEWLATVRATEKRGSQNKLWRSRVSPE